MRKIFLFVFCLVLWGCSTSTNKDGKQISELLNSGLSELKNGHYDDAALYFKEIDKQYPYSSTAAISSVLAAYAWYKDGGDGYSKAINELEVFLKYHPSHKYVAYAMYLKGVCLLKQLTRVGRSQENTLKARAAFVDLIKQFPDTEYSKNADDIIVKLDTSIAAHFMCIAKYYQFKKKDYLAATGRYLDVVQNYLYTNQGPEALYRLVECYLSVGLDFLAKDVYSEMKRLFPKSGWTLEAVKKFSKKLNNG